VQGEQPVLLVEQLDVQAQRLGVELSGLVEVVDREATEGFGFREHDRFLSVAVFSVYPYDRS
jgi:hypothetical protein